jgi:cell division protease FtsH
MQSDRGKESQDELKDKFRSFFGIQDTRKKKDGLPPKARFSIWYFLVAILLFSYLQQSLFSAKVETISYSQFKQYVAEGSAGELTIGPENITGTLKLKESEPDQRFTTIRVNDPDLVKRKPARLMKRSFGLLMKPIKGCEESSPLNGIF